MVSNLSSVYEFCLECYDFNAETIVEISLSTFEISTYHDYTTIE